MNKKIFAILLILILVVFFGAFAAKKNNPGNIGYNPPRKWDLNNSTLPVPTQSSALTNNDSKNMNPAATQPLNKEEVRKRLSQVNVASLYERVTDGAMYERNDDEVVKLLKETNTDLILRGFWRWYPVPESPDNIPAEFSKLLGMTSEQLKKEVNKTGYSHSQLRETITEIKKDSPNTIFVGAIPAQYINAIELNEVTGEVLDADKVQKMLLNPEKWGIKLNPILQLIYGDKLKQCPDITNPDFQELILSWAKKQIDDGVDAIWIDLLYTQVEALRNIAGADSPAFKESYNAASRIIDEIHKYGNSKGKYIAVGTWAFPAINFPYPVPDLDFVTLTPSASEISQKKLNDKSWSNNINRIKEKFGNIPVFVFIDWSDNDTPMSTFSQKLNSEEQNQMLVYLDNFSESKGMIFVYPVHGGNMGSKSIIRSFGMNNDYGRVYDSLAPEFQTYNTIKELAQNKK